MRAKLLSGQRLIRGLIIFICAALLLGLSLYALNAKVETEKPKRKLSERTKPGWKHPVKVCPVCGAGIERDMGEAVGSTPSGDIGTPKGGFGDGIKGYAKYFNSANKDFMAIPVNDSLQLGSSATVSIWAKPTSEQSGVLIHHTNWNNWIIWTPDNQAEVRIRTSPSAPPGFSVKNPENLQPGQWYHFVFTYDGDTLKLYMNGILVGTNTDPSGAMTGGGYYQYVNIGRYASPHSGYSDYYFDGFIDEPKIYNRPLNDDDIAALYNYELRGQDLPNTLKEGLVGSWSFDDEDYRDQSGYNNHGAFRVEYPQNP